MQTFNQFLSNISDLLNHLKLKKSTSEYVSTQKSQYTMNYNTKLLQFLFKVILALVTQLSNISALVLHSNFKFRDERKTVQFGHTEGHTENI